MSNIITATDSYKFSHHAMLPENTESVYSHFEARTGAQFNKTLFFGLQYILVKFLVGARVNPLGIRAAQDLSAVHFGSPDIFNHAMWSHIWNKHEGKLPIEIRAVPEGTLVPVNNVLMTVENTDPKCAALTNHLETILSQVWWNFAPSHRNMARVTP